MIEINTPGIDADLLRRRIEHELARHRADGATAPNYEWNELTAALVRAQLCSQRVGQAPGIDDFPPAWPRWLRRAACGFSRGLLFLLRIVTVPQDYYNRAGLDAQRLIVERLQALEERLRSLDARLTALEEAAAAAVRDAPPAAEGRRP
jgi:hypothetical protein